MSVEVRFPGPLQALTGGARSAIAQGETVGAVLEELTKQFPGLRERLIAQDGQIHRFVNLYLNDEDIRFLGGLAAPIESGDVLAILPALAGG